MARVSFAVTAQSVSSPRTFTHPIFSIASSVWGGGGKWEEKEKGGKRAEAKKTGGSDRQFSHIMSNADQQPFGIHFLLATQVESAEAHILF